MDNVGSAQDTSIEVVFKCRAEHQKYLITFILDCSAVTIDDLAELLEVPTSLLRLVRAGNGGTLSSIVMKQLIEIFCML